MNVTNDGKTYNAMLVKLLISIIMYVSICVMSVIILYEGGMNDLFDNKSFTGIISVILLMPSIIYLGKYYKPVITGDNTNNKIILYVIIGIIVSSLLNLPYKILSGQHNKPEHYTYFIGMDLPGRSLYLVLLVIIAPVIEEIFDRYYSYNILKDKYGVRSGIILSSTIFMLLHGKIDLGLFISGVLFALIYEKSKKIWASMIVHGAMNLIWFTLVYFA